jgi:hypothetical protein
MIIPLRNDQKMGLTHTKKMMCNGNTINELGEPYNLRIPLHYSVVGLIIFKSIAHVPKPFQVTR